METGPFIDKKKCNLCGKCIEICPKQILIKKDGALELLSGDCILCSHCYSVCRRNAIGFGDSLHEIGFQSFPYKENMIPPGKYDPGLLVNLFRSRRSVRKYQIKPVPDPVLADLVEFASTAPSGSNCQDWEFTVLNTREKVFGLAAEIGNFFMKMNAIVRNPVLRYLTFFIAGKKLIRYYNNHYVSVQKGLADAEKGRDPLFHGAAALIIVHSSMEGSLPAEDAQYASYNITLLAHSLGLGTCYIGYASEVLNSAKKIKNILKIPSSNRVHAVLALGYPDCTYHRPALRKPYPIQWV